MDTTKNAIEDICNACGKKIKWEEMSRHNATYYVAWGVCPDCNMSESKEWEQDENTKTTE